ncbi:MAG: hypothetical protein D3920_14145 [Candidatus Electrothrix sp. AW2]|nr:hypothetical protein [Candidatus Electrothrix gigas]
MAEPVFRPFVTATVKHEDVEAAPGKEELVRGVHNFLTAKVPDVDPQGGITVLFYLPVADTDPVGSVFVGVKVLAEELLNQRGLACCAFADEKEFNLVEWAFLLLERSEVLADSMDALVSNFNRW